MTRTFSYIAIGILLTLALLFILSPYKANSNKESLTTCIQVDKDKSEVYKYLSNSNNAKDWSTYVDHITTLNAETHQDGQVGSTRRCFKSKDEIGITWDEDITALVQDSFRELRIYNTKEFPVMINDLHTSQIYRSINPNTSELCLSLYLHRESTLTDWIKFKLFSYEVNRVFNNNLTKIKTIIESN